MMDEKDKCKSCKGKKVYKDRKVLEVVVEKGMKHGQKIKFSDEADELPGTLPGDVVFVIQEKEHEHFKRKGADLVYSVDLKLSEALCGFTRTITHLDGRVLAIESKPGEVIKPEAVKGIQGEGMPYHGNPFTKGRLFIHFRVEFPTSLPVAAVNSIRSVLPAVPKTALTGEEEECHMIDVDLSQLGQGEGHGHEQDDDDDQRGGQQRVQCNNM
jgi:DnaJ family protein A protein 2